MSKDDQDKNKLKEEISIVEKLKFWEEQDRINSSLIPRVVKMHEAITELSKTVNSYSNLYAKHESRIKNEFNDKLNESRALQKSLKEQSKTLTDLAIQSKDAIRKIDDFKTKDLVEIDKVINSKFNESKKLIENNKIEGQEVIEGVANKIEKKINDLDLSIVETSNEMNEQILLLKKRNNYLLFLIIIFGLIGIYGVIT